MSESMAGTLEGIRVIDLSRALAGPYCSMMLGDMGADVIKVEQPGSGDEARSWGPPFLNGESTYFMSVNRNKRSLTLDLKDEKGQEALRRLIVTADVLLENFSPGVLERLGFGWETLQRLNPRLIYCAVSGFGLAGPRKNQPAYDQILQGMGGLMSVTGEAEGQPTRFGVSIADITSGLFSAFAIMNALFHRERTGLGQMVDTSLMEGQIALLTFQGARYLATGEVPGRIGNRHPNIAPYEVLPTADGFVNVAVGNDKLWSFFCKALDLNELWQDQELRTNRGRVANRVRLQEALVERFSRHSTAEIIGILEEAKVPCGPIYTIDQVFADPQVKALEIVQRIQHPLAGEISLTKPPYRLTAAPSSIRRPPPALGEHNAEILAEIGLE